MKRTRRHGLAAVGLIVAGCATNPPLMFGDNTTFGLRLGNDTATGGASVSLGYKAQSIAVVPVSVLDEKGKAWLLKGHGGDRTDAMSVFASFESAAGPSNSASSASKDSMVQLGQIFSTGLAAQSLTQGYKCRALAGVGCTATSPVTPPDAPVPASTVATAAAAQSSASDRPYQAPLLFLRTDSAGIDIGGSLAEQGLQFNLGVVTRNLALIPVHTVGAGGKVNRITSSTDGADDAAQRPLDVLSVLGQFKVNTETTRLGFGLDRYFATGVAARNLGEGIQATIAKVPAENAAPQAAQAAVTPSAAASAVASAPASTLASASTK